MGMETGTALLLSSLIGGGAGIGSQLMQGDPQQFTSFAGTENDPGALLSDARSKINDVFARVLKQADTPPDLSDAYVQDLPSVGGPNLPIDIPSEAHASWSGGRKPAAPMASDASAFPTHPGVPPATTVPDVRRPITDGLLEALGTTAANESRTAASSPQRLAYRAPGTSAPKTPGSPAMGAAQILLHLANGAA